ncbi:uncharacterized protein LOC123544463 [Mercenaria mercenaria]|uniref:uncharacterized protein LOC123544463 n=1 Tax=Mercenaria mercenaria TaxID=6596 RepID=UPI001E1D4E3C|nr:uncharacterized protein LOC123544463 [Mercenaria mercenaria]
MPRGRVRQRGGRARGRAHGRGMPRPQDNDANPVPVANQPENRPNTRGQKRRADDLGQEDRSPQRGPAAQALGDEEFDEGDNQLLQGEKDVWVLGDSIPYWAGIRATDTGKVNLRLPDLTIAWWGVRGLGWTSFRNSIETQVLLSPPPKIIIIHLGGNDLASLSLIKMRRSIKGEIEYLREAFPDTVLIWVDILPRRVWRGSRT